MNNFDATPMTLRIFNGNTHRIQNTTNRVLNFLLQRRIFVLIKHEMSKSLSSIQPGQLVTVVSIHDSALKPKLMEMGLIQGKEVTVLFRAPFGDPIAIDVHGYILSLRLDEAGLIEVEVPSKKEVFA